jgi:SAM-dependent methyltransferase
MELKVKITEIMENKINKVVISNPKTSTKKYNKIVMSLKDNYYQVSRYTDQQVFHENIDADKLLETIVDFSDVYRQYNFWSNENEFALRITKKGKLQYSKRKVDKVLKSEGTQHNREKNYILAEGMIIEPLIDMGIITRNGKIIASMYDKFKQINRFIEVIDDFIKEKDYKQLNIIDFGCGKSYLTFVLYYYFTAIKNIDVRIVGLDLKKDVIESCNIAAEKYNYKNLHFELGDINGYQADFNVDMVITLHACDTATDYALYNAIKWNAEMIFSVPCCQHELNSQIESESYPIITRYGIAKERISALYTDIIRCNLLSYMSYKTQLMEFVDLSHTPKNLLIRAHLTNVPLKVKNERLNEVENLIKEFNLSPKLYELLVK